MRTKFVFGEKAEKYEAIKQQKISSLVYNITYHCNMGCKHCYHRPSGRELNTIEVRAALTEARENGIKAVVFTGGEPLLREDIFEVLNFSADLGLYNIFISNGIILNQDRIRRLKQAQTTRIQLSLDGFECTNDNYRCKGHYQKMLDLIDMLKSEGFHVGISVCVLADNYKELPELFMYLWKEKGVSEVRIMRQIPSLPYVPVEIKKDNFNRYREVLANLMADMIDHPEISIESEEPPLALLDIVPQGIMNRIVFHPCRCLYNLVTLEANGNVSICPIYSKNIFIGSLVREPLSELIAKAGAMTFFWKLRDDCKGCAYFDQCLGGCRCSAYYNTYDPSLPDPFCPAKQDDLK